MKGNMGLKRSIIIIVTILMAVLMSTGAVIATDESEIAEEQVLIAGIETAVKTDAPLVTAEEQNKTYSQITELLGTKITTEKQPIMVRNERSGLTYTRYELENGESIGIDEKLGIINITNFNMVEGYCSSKTFEEIAKVLVKTLSLEEYVMKENGVDEDDPYTYNMVWQRPIGDSGLLNEYDSVWVLIDVDSKQLMYLERYMVKADINETIVTSDEAFSNALEYLKNNVLYSRVTNLEKCDFREKLYYTSIEGKSILVYSFRNDYYRLIIDASNGKVLKFSGTEKNSKVFGCPNTAILYAPQKMKLAQKGFSALGYVTKPSYTCTDSAATNAIKNYWRGTSSYGFYITAHGTITTMSDGYSGHSATWSVSYTDVPSTKNWNFVFLDSCSSSSYYWSNAFHIYSYSTDSAFIGYKDSPYQDDTYQFAVYFWRVIGSRTIKNCLNYAKTAPGMDDSYPVFRGDSSYYGFV